MRQLLGMKGFDFMIYFDNSATTKIYPQALDSYLTVSRDYFANPSSLHQLGEVASKLLAQSRKQIADLLGVGEDEIYFTSGGSEGDNWVIKGTALEKSYYGKHIITTKIEHSAVSNTMKQLESLGFEITYLDVNDQGQVDLDDFKRALRKDTILVSMIAVNNEIGSIQPIDEIGNILRDYPSIHFHLDAVQATHIDLNLGSNSRVDMAVYSAHKFHGPRGVGFIYKKRSKNLAPLINGGGQESGLRSSTENLPAIVAMAKALRLLRDKNKQSNIKELTDAIRQKLKNYEDILIFSPKEGASHILCFGIKNVRGEVSVHAFEEHGIYISTTSACSSKNTSKSSTLSAMGIPPHQAETAVRVSLTYDNTIEEVDRFIEVLDQVYADLKVVRESK